MRALLYRFISPPQYPDDEQKNRAAQVLYATLWLTIAVYIAVLFYLPFSPALISGSIAIGSLLLASIIGVIWLHAGHVWWVARGFVIFLWLSATVLVLISGGIINPEVAGFIVAIMAAGLLLGLQSTIIFTGLSLFSVLAILIIQTRGWVNISFFPVSPLTGMIVATTNIVMTTSFLYLTLENLNHALERARLNSKELEQERANLENTVAQRTQALEVALRDARAARQTVEADAWQSAAQAALSQVMSGEQNISTLANQVVYQICMTLKALVGVLYVTDESEQELTLRLMGSFAFPHRKRLMNTFHAGEGLVGQAALEKKIIIFSPVPQDYLPTTSALVQVTPAQIVVAPFQYEDQVMGVLELSLPAEITGAQADYLEKTLSSIALAFHTAQTRSQVNLLLARTQEQAEALRLREEALKSVNEELQVQAENLRNSQEKLRSQQDQLEATNVELEERSAILQEQRSILDTQNRELISAQHELEAKTEALTLADKYKSEFLANMSHELRTPLNSLLILSRLLANNQEGNLNTDQVESAQIIYKSGSDLLVLINEILDLSKIEAGRMIFHFAPMTLIQLIHNLQTQFDPIAKERNLSFDIVLATDLPEIIETDQQRVEQVLKNLLSNAFKFTEQGSVVLSITRSANEIVLSVSDTGIGMSPEQQSRVFDAFQQGDGSTSRKYGGTGLGLTISRQLATRLGGKISLESELNHGSIFRLHLPIHRESGPEEALPALETGDQTPMSSSDASVAEPAAPLALIPFLPDDRQDLNKGDKVLLVIEDDPQFAKIVFNFAHQKDFKCLLAGDGENGLVMAGTYQPDAVILDLKLPGVSGLEVLDRLKQDAKLRHIPVHILSAMEETLDIYKRGALGYLAKPVSPEGLDSVFTKISDFMARDIKTLLLIEDDASLRQSVRQLLGGKDVKISEAPKGATALKLLRSLRFDCIILDLSLPDMTGFELLNKINEDESIPKCPIIVYTGKALDEEENTELMKYADSVIIKGVKSPERLLDETALFLHRVVADMSEENQRTIQRLHGQEDSFMGKHVVVVDDDMRNAFALSHLLSDKGLKVSIASSGIKVLEMLDANPDFDLILMDMMMPDMDGYETIKHIRSQDRFRNLAILALTAKAMKGDREKCISAGANDYLSKPIDADRLFSMLRVWLYR